MGQLLYREIVDGQFPMPHSLGIGLGPITNLVETHSEFKRGTSVKPVL